MTKYITQIKNPLDANDPYIIKDPNASDIHQLVDGMMPDYLHADNPLFDEKCHYMLLSGIEFGVKNTPIEKMMDGIHYEWVGNNQIATTVIPTFYQMKEPKTGFATAGIWVETTFDKKDTNTIDATLYTHKLGIWGLSHKKNNGLLVINSHIDRNGNGNYVQNDYGVVSKLDFPEDASQFLNGEGNWATPSGSNNYYHTPVYSSGIKIGNGNPSGTLADLYVPTGTAGTQVALGNHSHGNISNTGTVSATGTIASGDNFIFRDVSDGNKIKASSITFGSGTTTFLRNDGTWATPDNTNYYHTPVYSSGLKIGTGTPSGSLNDLYVPNASTAQAGVTKVGTSGGAASYSHSHGNISNTGTVSSTGTIASGNRLLITQSNTVKASSITFGNDTTTFLRNDGTWAGIYFNPVATVTFTSTPLSVNMTNDKSYYNFYDNGGSSKYINIYNISTNNLGHIVYFRIANQTANTVNYIITGTNLKGDGGISIGSNKLVEFSCIITYGNSNGTAWGILTHTNEIAF